MPAQGARIAPPIFETKAVAYIDILGFDAMVRSSEQNGAPSLAELVKLVQLLEIDPGSIATKQLGPTICPDAPYQNRDLLLKVSRFSDGVVLSAEATPAGVVNLLFACRIVAFRLLRRGRLVRGHVRLGSVYHSDRDVMGSGYMDAYNRERAVAVQSSGRELDQGTPFIEVAPELAILISNGAGERCTHQVFWQLCLGSLEDGIAINPFGVIGPHLADSGDPARDVDGLNRLIGDIRDLINLVASEVDNASEKARVKISHYVRCLNEQIELCSRTISMIDELSKPFPR